VVHLRTSEGDGIAELLNHHAIPRPARYDADEDKDNADIEQKNTVLVGST